MADVLAVAAASYGIVMAVSPSLQIRRMLQRRSSNDVSLTYLAVLLPGFVLWVAYGLSIANPTIAIPNAIALTVGSATMIVAWRLRSGDAGTQT